jgi:hypothetical protein
MYDFQEANPMNKTKQPEHINKKLIKAVVAAA